MSGGVVRHATKQVSATKEILMGLAFGVTGGAIWRAWHLSYKNAVDDFYRNYDAAQAKKDKQ